MIHIPFLQMRDLKPEQHPELPMWLSLSLFGYCFCSFVVVDKVCVRKKLKSTGFASRKKEHTSHTQTNRAST